jgi:hypothetical protein
VGNRLDLDVTDIAVRPAGGNRRADNHGAERKPGQAPAGDTHHTEASFWRMTITLTFPAA